MASETLFLMVAMWAQTLHLVNNDVKQLNTWNHLQESDFIDFKESEQGHHIGKRWHTHTHCSDHITVCWYSRRAGHNVMRTSIVRSNVITAIMPGLGWWTNSDSVHRWSLRPLLTRSFSMFPRRRCVTRSPANVFNMRRRLVHANLCSSQQEYSLSLSCVSLSPSLWVL